MHIVDEVENHVLSRREQNREDAYLCIHKAAYQLSVVQAQPTTVEEIAVAAGVSPRTFFNYFRSKEEAIFGIRDPKLTADQISRLEDGELSDLFDTVVAVLVEVVQATVVDPDSFRSRIGPFREKHEHKVFMARHMARCELLVNDVLSERFENAPALESDLANASDSARAFSILAASVLKFTFITYPDALTSSEQVRTREALAVFRSVVKETL